MYKSMKEFKQDWVKALRSGEYKQARNRLCKFGEKHDNFCCLGVAFDLLVLAGHRVRWNDYGEAIDMKGTSRRGRLTDLTLPKWLNNWLSADYLDGDRECKLIGMNDGGKSFKTIANFIEKEG